jgi:hypothetical protein
MAAKFAADCRFLRYSIESGSADGPVIARCEHPIRSGFRCIGPFLDETPTPCALWERGDRPGEKPIGGAA